MLAFRFFYSSSSSSKALKEISPDHWCVLLCWAVCQLMNKEATARERLPHQHSDQSLWRAEVVQLSLHQSQQPTGRSRRWCHHAKSMMSCRYIWMEWFDCLFPVYNRWDSPIIYCTWHQVQAWTAFDQTLLLNLTLHPKEGKTREDTHIACEVNTSIIN